MDILNYNMITYAYTRTQTLTQVNYTNQQLSHMRMHTYYDSP